jgi:hypothetical protein
MLPVIEPPIRKGICHFIIDFKIVSTTIIYKQHTIIVVIAVFILFPLF